MAINVHENANAGAQPLQQDAPMFALDLEHPPRWLDLEHPLTWSTPPCWGGSATEESHAALCWSMLQLNRPPGRSEAVLEAGGGCRAYTYVYGRPTAFARGPGPDVFFVKSFLCKPQKNSYVYLF